MCSSSMVSTFIHFQIIKFQAHATHLEQQNKGLQQQIQTLSAELEQQLQREVTATEHWNIIKILFEDNRNENCVMLEKGSQAMVGKFITWLHL